MQRRTPMKLNKTNIAIAVAVALAIVLPWMVLGGDLGTGQAAFNYDYGGGWGEPVWVPEDLCVQFPWAC